MSPDTRPNRPTTRTFRRGERIRTVDAKRTTNRRGLFVSLADPADAITVPCPAALAGKRYTDAAFVLFDGDSLPRFVPYEHLFSE